MKPGQFSFSDDSPEASHWRDIACVGLHRAGLTNVMLLAMGVALIAPEARASIFAVKKEPPVPVMIAPTPKFTEAQIRNASDAPRGEQRLWGAPVKKVEDLERSVPGCAKIFAGKKVLVEISRGEGMSRSYAAHALNSLSALGAQIITDGKEEPDYTVRIEASTRPLTMERVSGDMEQVSYPEVSVEIIPRDSAGVYAAAGTESLGETLAQICAYPKVSVVNSVFENALSNLAAAKAMRDRIGTGAQRDADLAHKQSMELDQASGPTSHDAPELR